MKDVNDNAPAWPSVIFVAVRENSPATMPIVQLNATDRDQGVNSQVHYYMNIAHSRRWPQYGFEIDRLTGRLTVRRPLDREDVKNILLEVFAVDQGSPAMTSQALVNITVLGELLLLSAFSINQLNSHELPFAPQTRMTMTRNSGSRFIAST